MKQVCRQTLPSQDRCITQGLHKETDAAEMKQLLEQMDCSGNCITPVLVAVIKNFILWNEPLTVSLEI